MQGICAILQEINLPSVRVEPVTAEVLEHNELFSSLVHPVSSRNYRLWFVEGVLPHLASTDRSRWEADFANETSHSLPVSFTAADGRIANYKMHSVPAPGNKNFVQSIVCVFVPQISLSLSRKKLVAEGRESSELDDSDQLDIAGHQQAAARGQHSAGALLLVGRHAEKSMGCDDDSRE